MNYSTRFFWAGVLTIVLGLVVLFNAAVASGAIVVVTGIVLLIGGAAQVVLGFLEEGSGRKWLTLALGFLTVFLGWSFLSNPLAGIVSLTTFLLILMAASGAVQVLFGLRARGTPFFWPLILSGLASILLAIILLSSPSATISLLGFLLGLHMLASGACLTMVGLYMKKLDALKK
ncbi:hypothetical protein G8770_11490 [Aestuariicella hydrocarbonica]|uniref:HdeD family acid-resistance protein n=1 Tax=Pseudomaricurvus hydrocarbonicus TaxID=1470433 RepID=A0A9E5MME3_9GAMM|nr:DUF308 domain-containing protein [Aestuariicella hydrocarbonica]NHO66170.1 hypothetical protein [Aestuariicella hydrocarbonica]